MFRTSVVVAANQCCGCKVVGACSCGNTRTHWWKLVVRDAVKLKKDFYWGFLPVGLQRQQTGTGKPSGMPVVAVAEAKTQKWEEFGEAMENNIEF